MLTSHHYKAVCEIDQHVVITLARPDGEEALLRSLYDYLERFKDVMNCAAPREFDYLCQEYEGVYYFGKILEQLSNAIANGNLRVPDAVKLEA